MRDQFRRSPVSRSALTIMNPDSKRNIGPLTKPFTPALSAAIRSNRSTSPLTPRLAGSSNYQTARKAPYTDVTSSIPLKEPSDAGLTFPSTNLPPRSGPQNLRRDDISLPAESNHVGSQHVPESSYPSPSPPMAGYRTEHSPARANGKTGPPRTARAKSVTGDGHTGRFATHPGSSCESSVEAPMFFHADDASTSMPCYGREHRPRSYAKLSQASSFVYADGTREEEPLTDGSSSPLVIATRRSTSSAQSTLAAKPGPMISPRLKSPQPAGLELKLASNDSSRSNFDPESILVPIALQSSPSHDHLEQSRRASPVKSLEPHRKLCGVNATPQLTSTPSAPRASPITPSSVLTDTVVCAAQPNLDLSPRIVGNRAPDPTDVHSAFPLAPSPIRMDGNTQHIEESAINARTERKVLDLEISNSSLLAINRTLERELRKQNAELRRYRRLGRLSIATSARSVSGGGLSVVSEMEDRFSDQSSVHSVDGLSDLSDNDSSFLNDDTQSPGAVAERDAYHRLNDEKRFCLDLAKHQELLLDSQKINQSLRRCIGWAEELIREGRKALEYHVHVNDVEIGGRVLALDDLSDDGYNTHDLLDSAGEE
jgi:hypothetical protein